MAVGLDDVDGWYSMGASKSFGCCVVVLLVVFGLSDAP